jgi:hypothetical protein
MSGIRRTSRTAWLLAIALGCGGLLGTNAWSNSVGHIPAAEAAGSLSVNDSAHLHLVHASGPTLFEEGRGAGTLPGTVKATLTLKGATATSACTIEVRGGGSITGGGAGTLHEGHGGYESFAGELTVTHGSGRYAHASGTGKIYGTIDRVNDDAVVQVIGVLHL